MFKVLVTSLVLFSFQSCMRSCSPIPEPIQFGRDSCEHCHMVIVDPQFGGELVTQKGRIYKFDSLSCLLNYYENMNETPAQIFAVDYLHSGALIDVHAAHFMIAEQIHGPMGPTPIASTDLAGLQTLVEKIKGEITNWSKIVTSIKK